MNKALKVTAALFTILAINPVEAAGRWSRDRVIEQPRTTTKPAPAIPGVPDATLQYRTELARVTAMLANNPNVFGGFNMTNTLAELRAQVDRNIRTRQARELAKATTPFERAMLSAKHKAFWSGLKARRELRNKFTDEQNIVHSLMMILKTKAKLQ